MKHLLNITLLFLSINVFAQNSEQLEYKLIENIQYVDNSQDQYINERCKLDIYYPTDKKDFSTIVWFHGGGLEGGNKHIPDELKDKGVAVVAVNYRLSPQAKAPAYIEDAAAAIAWAFNNIENYGGSVNDIYVSGHSAGGYLTLMVGLDKSFLAKHDIDANSIKGLVPISGQTITHNAIRKEMGLPDDIPYAKEYAPINLIRKGIPPTLLVVGDRNLELPSRVEENLYLQSAMKTKNNHVFLCELQGFDHGTVLSPGCLLLLDWIDVWSK